jgi:hypothetical protein
VKRDVAYWEAQDAALAAALRALDAVRDRWRARQGGEPSWEHRAPVIAAWTAAMDRDRTVSP